jgi:hypothetical protein
MPLKSVRGPGHVAVREVVAHRLQVDLGPDARHPEERLHLRGEEHRAAALAKIQRLLAEAVAREQQPLLARVPHREGELAAQVVHHFEAPVLVGAQQHLGVGIEREAVTALRELGAQLAEVVDLAVERERDARGLVAHGLARAVRVDDGEAAVAEHDAVLRALERARASAVGPAMRQGLEHRGHGAVVGRVLGQGHPAGNSAHGDDRMRPLD